MVTIKIQIDVQNPHEIVKQEKGFLTGAIAGLLMSKDKLTQKVEEAISEEVVKALKENMEKGFAEKGVRANLVFTVEKSQDHIA